MIYEKRFRLSVVVKYESKQPLGDVDEARAQQELQHLIDYAHDKWAEVPAARLVGPGAAGAWDYAGPVAVVVEVPEPARSVRELVEKVVRALERKGFDVT